MKRLETGIRTALWISMSTPEMLWDPIVMHCTGLCPPGGQATNLWGVTAIWPEGTPGPFPLTDDEHLLLKDVIEWKRGDQSA